MGKIIINPELTEKQIDKLDGWCPIKTLNRKCICKEFARSGRIGLCEGKLYFRQPDMVDFVMKDVVFNK